MKQKTKHPRKPSAAAWLLSSVIVMIGLLQLYSFAHQGYIAITPGGIRPGEHYTGALAVVVMAVTLGVGLFSLGSTLRSWWFARKTHEHDVTD